MNSLPRGLRSRWFVERFHINALVTYFEDGQFFGLDRQIEDYAVARLLTSSMRALEAPRGSYVEYVQKLGHEAPGIYS